MDIELIMPFGKYKGKPVKDIPFGYLLFLYDRNKLSGKIKTFAEENIPVLKFDKRSKK